MLVQELVVVSAGNDPSDELLFGKVKEGDEVSLRLLLARYRERLQALVERQLPGRLRRRFSVADVLQEIRIAVLQGRSQFEDRGPDSFRKWVFGIAANKVRETLRRHAGTNKRAANREVSRGMRRDTTQFPAQGPSPSEAAMASELAERVRVAMNALPDDYREVLRLTRQEGLTLRETAEHMGRSREAVKKLYGRAFLKFKQIFEEQRKA